MARPRKPPRVWQRKDGRWFILDGGTQYGTDGAETEEEAMVALGHYLRKRASVVVSLPHPRKKALGPEHTALKKALSRALRGAKSRATGKGRDYALDLDGIMKLLREQGGVCAVTGVQFRFVTAGYRINPYGISIDRIDSKAGYTPGNVRLVTTFVNLAMGDFGEALFRDFVDEMVAKGIAEQLKRCMKLGSAGDAISKKAVSR